MHSERDFESSEECSTHYLESVNETGQNAFVVREENNITEKPPKGKLQKFPYIKIFQCIFCTERGEWTQPETTLLLERFKQYLPRVREKFRSKKQMWIQISKDLLEQLNKRKTWVQCENRYKTLLKRRPRKKQEKIIKPVDAEIFMVMNDYVAQRENNEQDLNAVEESTDCNEDRKKTCGCTIKKLQEIIEKKERNKEKRHREKMDLLRRIFLPEEVNEVYDQEIQYITIEGNKPRKRKLINK